MSDPKEQKSSLFRVKPIWLVLASLVLTVTMLEVAARIWVALRWQEGSREELLAVVNSWKGYIHDPKTGYRLEPGYYRKDKKGREFTHNQFGMRGPEVSVPKDSGTTRIMLMGASTVYGPYVNDSETSAVRLQEWLKGQYTDRAFEVLNAGVPGWTSRETLENLRVQLPLVDPDIVLIMDGRNELFPQLFNGYRDDYGHYRRLGFDFREGNKTYKAVFHYSYLAMLLTTGRGYRFGYSPAMSNPVYGYIRYENKPNPSELIQNAKDRTRLNGFESNLETIVAVAQDHGVQVVLASIPFFAERFISGVFLKDPTYLSDLEMFVSLNNQFAQQLAEKKGLPFVDTKDLSTAEFLVDDCHFLPEGEMLFAERAGEAIKTILE